MTLVLGPLSDALLAEVRQIVREELARVGMRPPNPHGAPGVYRVDAAGTWQRVPEAG